MEIFVPRWLEATIREIPICLLVHIIACLLLTTQSHCCNKGYNIMFSESDQFISKLILHVYYCRVCVLVSKTCVKRPLKIDETNILMTHGSLMKVQSIAECSPWSILQYFWPALYDNWSWKPIFGIFESDSFTRFYYIIKKSCRWHCPFYCVHNQYCWVKVNI